MKIEYFFHDDHAPKVRTPHKCLAMRRSESISITKDLKCYPHIFLEELKVNNRRNARMSRNAFDESDKMPESDVVDDDEFTVEKPSKKSRKPFMTSEYDNESGNNDNNNNDDNEFDNNDNNEFENNDNNESK